MTVVGEFCGRVLDRGKDIELSEQLYDVLRHEILRGRWQVGEKIPSYNDIINQTGLSKTPVQSALGRLEADGYVRRVRHKGVFVKATATPGNRSLGTVAIAIPATAETNPHDNMPRVDTQSFGRVNVGSLLASAAKLGLKTSVCRIGSEEGDEFLWLPPSDDVGPELFGVLSLVSSDLLHRALGRREPAKVVYLGTDDPLAQPCLTGDPCAAAYLVVRELLRYGHERIALMPDPMLHRNVDLAVRNGIDRAFADAGLEALSASLPAMAGPEGPVPAGATAVFCFSIEHARHFLRSTHLGSIEVPAALSLASLQTGKSRLTEGMQILGAMYPWDSILNTGFDILLSPKTYAQRAITGLRFTPSLSVNESVATVTAANEKGN